MLSLGKIPPIAIRNPNPKFPSKSQFPFPIRLHLNVRNLQNGLHLAASKSKKKGSAEIDGHPDFEEDFDDEVFDDGEFDDDDDDDDDDDEGVFIPLRNMKKWLNNRPQGFGEGRAYDTSIEDKLMEEIEQSRKAQLANVNKLKQQKGSIAKKETSRQDQGLANVQNGFRVRLTNLPKKKNIHRDLGRAFNEVPGILDIIPVVSGNEKTRDPVCKGFAFVNFKRLDDAHRFVQNFSGRSISFGRVEKQIQCDIVNSKSSNPASAQQSSNETYILPIRRLDLDEDSDAAAAAAVSETDVSLSDSWGESDTNEFDDADEGTFFVQLDADADFNDEDEDGEIIETSATAVDGDLSEQELESRDESSSIKKKGRRKDKKADAKRRKDKSPKLSIISGSAKRLKMKDKTVLTGVFSKYAAKAAVKEQTR